MAIRNTLFGWFNRFHNKLNIEPKFLALKHSPNNTELVARAKIYRELDQFARLDINTKAIRRAKLGEFERMEYDIISKYQEDGQNNPEVDPEDIVHQLDKIQILRKLKILETHKGDFNEDETQCLKLIAKVHLDEPNAQENLDNFVKDKPHVAKLLYLGQM